MDVVWESILDSGLGIHTPGVCGPGVDIPSVCSLGINTPGVCDPGVSTPGVCGLGINTVYVVWESILQLHCHISEASLEFVPSFSRNPNTWTFLPLFKLRGN